MKGRANDMPNTTLNYKNYRSNPIRSRNGHPTSGHCIECGRLTSNDMGGKRVTIPSQRNGVWVCYDHRGSKNLRDYCDENNTRVGKGNADGISISVELESMGVSTSARAYFVKNNFIPTHDSTVTIEYKSPIYTSELPLAKIIGAVEYMNNSNSYDFSVDNEHCGIHTHYGFIDNHFDFRDLSIHYSELFYPLSQLINEMSSCDRKEIFGRDFEEYAREIEFSCPSMHENWINIQHSYSLEIRMPRFITAKQYMRFLKTFKKIFKAINTHYIEHGCTRNAATKTGKKLVKVFKKEYAEYFPEEINTSNSNVEVGATNVTVNNSGVTITADGIIMNNDGSDIRINGNSISYRPEPNSEWIPLYATSSTTYTQVGDLSEDRRSA